MDRTRPVEVPNPEDYHISLDFGFLLPNPLTHLPEYFEPWDILAHKLPQMIEKHSVREEVHKLPELDYHKLKGHRQYRCAFLFLSTITSGYVWQEGDSGVTQVLPRQVAVPLHGVASYLGMQPIATHGSMVLANCRLVNKTRGTVLSNLTSEIQLFPREASNWFFIVTALSELSFAPAVKIMQNCWYAVLSEDTSLVEALLVDLVTVLVNMTEAVSKMHENLPGKVFYNNLRPIFAGWGGKGSPLPDGLIYDGVSTKPMKMTGSSEAQSSTLPCLDAFLGIQHQPDNRDFLEKMRIYMPPSHVKYIEAIEKAPPVRSFVLGSANTDLHKAYNKAVCALGEFRSYHIQIVTKYIVQQMNGNRNKKHESLENKGTGGSSILPFLKALRDSTLDAIIN